MKKYLLFFTALIFLAISSKTFAQPIIENVTVQPQNSFCFENTCDDIEISLNCFDDNSSIENVFGYISNPILSQNMTFYPDNNLYKLDLQSYFFATKSSNYNFVAYCQNNNSETNSTSIDFYVSNLEVGIDSLTAPAYIGSGADIKISIKKDNSAISNPNEVNFNLKLGGQNWNKLVYFDTSANLWILNFNPPSIKGNYNLDAEAEIDVPDYDHKAIQLKSTLEVRDPIEFKIVSVDKTEINPYDIITVSAYASEKGENIFLDKAYLSFKLGSQDIDKNNITITADGDYFKIKIPMPAFSPGSYDLKIKFDYKDYSLSDSRSIGYVLPVAGKFLDLNDKGISVEIKFLLNNVRKTMTTDSSGSYSGYVIPGNYTVQMNFPQSTLYLYGVNISSNFNDPIKYYFIDSDVEGIRNAGLFSYEVSVPFASAKIVMKYDEKKINEKDIAIYKCSDFNPSSKVCYTKWEEKVAIVDTVANSATVDTSSLSAYAIGTEKSLYLDFSSTKQIFNSNELIKIKGLTKDDSGSLVPKVLVNATVNDANIAISTYSDDSGIFNIEFFSPDQEGVYTILLKAQKIPYTDFNKTWSFQVAKSKSVSIVVPDTIRLRQGGNHTVQFSVANIGQTDLSNLSLSITGIPAEYFSLTNSIELIRVGQEIKIPVAFMIPKDASESTSSITFKVFSNEVSEEKVIGFTIFSENETAASTTSNSPAFRFPTANIILPAFSLDFVFIFVFAVVCVFGSYYLKKRKVKTKEREQVKNLLSDIKREIKRSETVQPMQVFNQLVENLSEKEKE